MSDAFMQHAHELGIIVKLIPTDAHHHLGAIERSHAVRRKQVEIYMSEHDADDLADRDNDLLPLPSVLELVVLVASTTVILAPDL